MITIDGSRKLKIHSLMLVYCLNHSESRWFRQSKFASFQRQLNLYGFKRLTSGTTIDCPNMDGCIRYSVFAHPPALVNAISLYSVDVILIINYWLKTLKRVGRDKCGYYHELFLRGMPHLANKILRTKLKNDGARKSTSPETEPNFYALPFLPDVVSNVARPDALGAVPELKRSTNTVSSSIHRTIPDSIASSGSGPSGSATVDSTYTLAQLAQSSNVLRLNNNLEQLRNLDLYSRLLPTTIPPTSTVYSGASSTTSRDADLLARLLYRDASNNVKASTPQLTQPFNLVGQTLTPLQQLLQQQPSTASLSMQPNSVLLSSPSILQTAQLALLRYQQQQEQQRTSILSNIISNGNNNTNNDLLALRLAIANGYTSIDHFLLDVAMGRNRPLTSSGSNYSTSTGSNMK